MKRWILLLLIACLLMGCAREEGPMPGFDPDTESSVTEDTTPEETEPEETAPEKTEAETETPIKKETRLFADAVSGEQADLSLLCDGDGGHTYYLTSVYENGEKTNLLEAAGAVTVGGDGEDNWYWYNERGAFYAQGPLREETVRYTRLYVDPCLYVLSDGLMAGEGGTFASARGEESFKTTPVHKGRTANGDSFVVYEGAPASDAETVYQVFLQVGEKGMAYLGLYAYAFDTEDYAEKVLFPLIDTVRTWSPEEGNLTVMKMQRYEGECLVTFDLPADWLWNNSSVINDSYRLLGGRYAIKRMELYSLRKESLGDESETDEYSITRDLMEAERGTLDSGYPYVLYRRDSRSEGEPLSVTWYYCEYLLGEDQYYVIAFLNFEDDRAGYFDEKMRPVMESVRIYLPEEAFFYD